MSGFDLRSAQDTEEAAGHILTIDDDGSIGTGKGETVFTNRGLILPISANSTVNLREELSFYYATVLIGGIGINVSFVGYLRSNGAIREFGSFDFGTSEDQSSFNIFSNASDEFLIQNHTASNRSLSIIIAGLVL